MKIDDVPQDKGYMVEGRISDLTYAVDKDGKYISTRSRGWKPKNEAMSLAWETAYEQINNARNEVLSGKYSPIAFYMELNLMDVKILAGYMGTSRLKVRRHLKMKNFKKLNSEILQKYAEIFGLSMNELTDLNKIREIKIEHED